MGLASFAQHLLLFSCYFIFSTPVINNRMCVKSIVDKSAFESINDDCPHLNNFCNVMEHIFSHRLQGQLLHTFHGIVLLLTAL